MVTYALKFISGRYQGTEFPISDDSEILIGRSPELDLVLAEDKVSRKHAKIGLDGQDLQIIDLGSTNGTYVNGERIRRQQLKTDDRILIGTSIARIITGDDITLDPNIVHNPVALKEMMADMNTRVDDSVSMSGTLEEVPLPDLLQLFCSNKKSGIVILKNKTTGKIYLKDGDILHAEIEDEPDVTSRKALGRMITWSSGEFRMETLPGAPPSRDLAGIPSHELILEAVRETDEIKRIKGDLPPLDSMLALCIPMVPKLSDLKGDELDTLQSVLNFGTLQEAIDGSTYSDGMAIIHLHKLLKEGYLEIDF